MLSTSTWPWSRSPLIDVIVGTLGPAAASDDPLAAASTTPPVTTATKRKTPRTPNTQTSFGKTHQKAEHVRHRHVAKQSLAVPIAASAEPA